MFQDFNGGSFYFILRDSVLLCLSTATSPNTHTDVLVGQFGFVLEGDENSVYLLSMTNI